MRLLLFSWCAVVVFLGTKVELGCGLAMPSLRLLEWVPSQQLLVKTAKAGWETAFKTLISEIAPQSAEGDYVRPSSQRGGNFLSLESGNYCVYVGNACPWCHRVALGLGVRGFPSHVKICELEDDATKASRGGWIVKDKDPIFGKNDLKEIYDAASGGTFNGRCTAPLLVDVDSKKIVSQESGDILRALCHMEKGNDVELRPSPLKDSIDTWNDKIYRVNDGVYRCGFATTQKAYERAYEALHAALRDIEAQLASTTKFLLGDKLTEADLRLYPTIARFDAAYATLFRCSPGLSLEAQYPNLATWRSTMQQIPAVNHSCDPNAAAASYYRSLFPLNPSGIIPHFSKDVAGGTYLSQQDDNNIDLVKRGLAFSKTTTTL